MARYRALRGMKDILPGEVRKWQLAEGKAREIFARHGFREIRTPILESYDLFARGIGEATDIVHKEMYRFERDGEAIALRPENTAPVVRAIIEHSLHHGVEAERLFYIGPQFRYERPQKGRQRQFHQIGVEALGEASPWSDAEVIGMVMEYLDALKLTGLTLRLGSVGDETCRPAYREALRAFLEPRLGSLCEDCRRRYRDNPLRVFDCKVESDRRALAAAPLLRDHLCAPCAEHDAGVRAGLEALGVAFREEGRLVRGLDYYVRTAFEVNAEGLGAQDAVLGGGRYDGLVRDLGGPDLPGFGFAIGLERVVLLLPDDHPDLPPDGIDAFLVAVGPAAQADLFPVAQRLRRAGLSVRHEYRPRSLRAQLDRADRLGARLALILGDDERARGACVLRRMSDGRQQEVPLAAAVEAARALLAAVDSRNDGEDRA
jgi:histidyl-tRNA synthetase